MCCDSDLISQTTGYWAIPYAWQLKREKIRLFDCFCKGQSNTIKVASKKIFDMLERDLTSFPWLDLRQTNKHIMQRQYKYTAHSIILNYCQCLQSRVHFILRVFCAGLMFSEPYREKQFRLSVAAETQNCLCLGISICIQVSAPPFLTTSFFPAASKRQSKHTHRPNWKKKKTLCNF